MNGLHAEMPHDFDFKPTKKMQELLVDNVINSRNINGNECRNIFLFLLMFGV